jgi:isopentenyl diphosphate isomerase/L-lactate dehydrogenase-like FMN-dependent dehydrogenase
MSKKEVRSDGEVRKGFSRREFITNAAMVGAGAIALTGLTRQEVLAQAQDAKPVVTPKDTASPPKVSDAKKLEEIMKVAREKLYPRCRVCPECDGVACGGEVPGMGGIGTGASFRNNVKALAVYKLQMRSLHDAAKPDTSITLFGQKLSMPILCASTAGTTYNMGLAGKMSEEDFINSILGGAMQAGTLGMAADGIEDPLDVYQKRLEAIKANGKGIAIMKPKGQDEVFQKIKLIEQSGAVAFGMDVDGAGRAARALPGQIVEPKNMKKLREIVGSTKVPFIIKGIMTVDEAQMAIDAGAAAIVVSNHGGRVLDHTPGTAEVLSKIAAKVKGKITILADGGIRNGYDVLKMLALGANAVMVGRPVIRGAVGGGKDGVALVLNKMRKELAEAMVLTGQSSVLKIKRSVVA